MHHTCQPLLLTLGDPNGLGPELLCRLLREHPVTVEAAPLLIIGPEQPLRLHAARMATPMPWERLTAPEEILEKSHGMWLYQPPELQDFTATPGKASPLGGRAAGLSLDLACDLCLRGVAKGMVTLPLNKAMLMAAGFPFPGHTEFLAAKAGLADSDVCMHLCGPTLRVSLVTTHPPLRQVPELLRTPRILHCLELTHDFLMTLGLKRGRIAVCGLNPHAGEGGAIGNEEAAVITPAIEQAREAGMDVHGPLPGDTVFHAAAQGRYDAVLAMYHDQGLAPLKLLHFNEAVNVTLGLPFVRTSVDHGTGYDIVGKDTASCTSLINALNLARNLITAKQ